MDAKTLFEKMKVKELSFRQKEFLAPYTKLSQTAVVKMDNVNYKFRIVGFGDKAGFGVFRPIDHSCAKYVQEAPFDKVRQYLELLPKIHFILCYESESGWIAFPMNAPSAEQSLGLQSEIIIQNVTDCERFDTITARFDGINFWYDEPFASANHARSEALRQAFKLDLITSVPEMMRGLSGISGITPEERESFELAVGSWIYYKQTTTEDILKRTLDLGGGRLLSYVVRGRHLEVKWKSDGNQEYKSIIDKENMNVFSAGICLSGQDRYFHLKDLPFLMRKAEDRGSVPLTNKGLTYNQDGSVNEDSMRYFSYETAIPEWQKDKK